MIFLVLLLASDPELCRATTRDASAIEVVHGGKTYRVKNAECRDQFLSDPERYSQLHDALAELDAAGAPSRPAQPSLVPS